MKKATTIKSMTAVLAAVIAVSGCGASKPQTTTAAQTNEAAQTNAAAQTTEAQMTTEDTEPATLETEDGPVEEPEESEAQEPESNETVGAVVSALKGPTAMGLTKLMSDEDKYDFTIYAAPDELTPLIIQGKTDIACIPANLASVLWNKTEGNIEVLALNTLGVLYIVENGNTISSVADLKGKTIYASGKGSTPEFALNYILRQNGIDPEKDVNIEWKTEHAECVSAISSDEGGIAMLPQPFVTTAMTKNENIKVALDLTAEWDALGTGSSMITGVVIGQKEFVEAAPEAVADFLAGYKESVGYVNTDTEGAAALIESYDIIPAAVAKKAIPACNIVCITGDEMKQKLSGYLQVLYDQLPASVGGTLPTDDFYYLG